MFLFEVGLNSLGAVEEETTLEGSAPGCANAFKGSFVLKVMTRRVNLSLLLSCLELDFSARLFICVVVNSYMAYTAQD